MNKGPKSYSISDVGLSKELWFICNTLALNSCSKKSEAINLGAVLKLVKQHHLESLFYKFESKRDISFENEEYVNFFNTLKESANYNRFQMMLKTSTLISVVNQLEEKGIPVISFKGPVLSKILYDDFTLKSSLDIDLLIDENDWERAIYILNNMGFVNSEYNFNFTPSQKKYLKNNFHHLGFYHPDKRIPLELHWQLSSNKRLFHYNFDDLFQLSQVVEISQNKLKTLSPTHQLIYSLVHGAFHGWTRIDWLYELNNMQILYQRYLPQFEHEICKFNLQNCYEISKTLSDTLFSINRNISVKNGNIKKSIYFVIYNLDKTRASRKSILQILKKKIYLMSLKPSLNYKLNLWTGLGTSLSDWKLVNLPDKLFFLYFIIRPFMVLSNRLFKNNSFAP